jgi:hypothetical protein
LADRMRAAVQAEGLEALVSDARGHVRQALRDSVEEESARTGTAFTARLDGWSAQMTDPEPKPRVTDAVALYEWTLQAGIDLGAKEVERVEVIDHAIVSDALSDYANLKADGASESMLLKALERLLGAIDFDYEVVLPEKPLDALLDTGRCQIVGNEGDGWALIDTETGESVPGVTVTRSAPTLRLVPKGKAQRQAAKREVARLLGVPAELTDGGA